MTITNGQRSGNYEVFPERATQTNPTRCPYDVSRSVVSSWFPARGASASRPVMSSTSDFLATADNASSLSSRAQASSPRKESIFDKILAMKPEEIRNLELTWSRSGDIRPYKNHENWSTIKSNRTEFFQGSRNILSLSSVTPNTYLWTKDLNPCVALMAVSGKSVTCMHVDALNCSFRSNIDRLKYEDPSKISIGIVGANDQGAASKVVMMLNQLKCIGLSDNVDMMAIGKA